MSTKKCCRCKQVKDITEFGKNRSTKDGLAWECLQCCKEIRASNEFKERRKQYDREHLEIAREQKRKWDDEHREQRRERQRINRLKHLDKISDRLKKWNLANPTYKLEYNREWRATHPERARAWHSKYDALEHGATGCHTAEEWIALCDQYGNRCLRCGHTDVKLTKDHVIPLSMGGSNDIGNLQPLCHSCNCSKKDKTQDFRH